ncbi:hypothetical protein ANACOL_01029 [Anaerotruncus colihominis DSM 17241]|uniref:Uncharacterized protein n=1 Tax=Anaerotruncus colihominis DSM 17241 TaxID=445972 RepID=B0P8E0_9FIRM|nr:hypothetical protein ANACOL_01029 [Anaerotruncus colihominis DSM 17241]
MWYNIHRCSRICSKAMGVDRWKRRSIKNPTAAAHFLEGAG